MLTIDQRLKQAISEIRLGFDRELVAQELDGIRIDLQLERDGTEPGTRPANQRRFMGRWHL